MGDTRDDYDWVFRIFAPVGIAVAVIVIGGVLITVWRHRSREGREAREIRALPAVEVVLVLGLAAVAVTLFTLSYRAESNEDALSARPGTSIEILGFRWNWAFRYPETGREVIGTFSHPATLVVPTGTVVRFAIHARDVVHSFWIPAMRFKRDAFPDATTRFDMEFPTPGRMAGRCAEFCGLRHDQMGFTVQAVTPARFRAWLAAPAGTPA